MSRIEALLSSILKAVYGQEVRQSIHDSIKECYQDVTNARTLADDAVTRANTAIDEAKTQLSDALTSAESRVGAAVAKANTATTEATEAANDAKSASSEAEKAAKTAGDAALACQTMTDSVPEKLDAMFSALKLSIHEGKLCVEVIRD